MNSVLVLVLILFLHILADFHLQGILASMKQLSWWQKQVPVEHFNLYKNDYKVALWIHAFEWAFVTYIPIFIVCVLKYKNIYITCSYIVILVINAYFHRLIDDEKANKERLNLLSDQVFHAVQIAFTWAFWSIFGGW